MQEEHTDRNEIMELIFAIMNLAHAEYHICETIQANINTENKVINYLSEYLNSIRTTRTILMQLLSKKRIAVKGLWCTFKHIFLALFSLYELMEKDKCNPIILKQASALNLLLDDMLSHNEFGNLKECARCEDESSN